MHKGKHFNEEKIFHSDAEIFSTYSQQHTQCSHCLEFVLSDINELNWNLLLNLVHICNYLRSLIMPLKLRARDFLDVFFNRKLVSLFIQ